MCATFLFDFSNLDIHKFYTFVYNSNYVGYAFPRGFSKISSLQRSCVPTASVEMIGRKIRVRSLLIADTPIGHVTLPHTKAVQRNEDIQKLVLSRELELASATTILCNTTITSLSFTRSVADSMHRSIECESNCHCVRCAFEKSADVLHIKSDAWIIGSESYDLSDYDALTLAGTYQSEMKLKFAAAMYSRVILSHSSTESDAHLLGDALHGLASLLLEAATVVDVDIDSAIIIRKHWRSSTKLWLAASALLPVCSMAQLEEQKLRAFGRYSFLKNISDLTTNDRDDLKSVSFSSFSINDNIEIPGNLFKKRSHTSAFQSTTSHQICVTTEPIISHDDCKFLIDAAELHAQSSGWTTSRHYSVPTTDIPIQECSLVLDWFFRSGFYDRLRCTLQLQFPDAFDGCPESMYINDAFIVRYSAKKQEKIDPIYSEKILWDENLINVSATAEDCQCFLPIHTDQSTHSVVISLNSGEYTGGGTYFAGLSSAVEGNYASACNIKCGVVLPTCGNMVSFEGCRLKHAGEPISSGKRYIIALFLFLGRKEREFDILDPSSNKTMKSTTVNYKRSDNIRSQQSLRAEDASRDQVTFGFNFYG